MQALSQKGSGKLLSPLPKEEDRRLPLKKWMESMKELVQDSKPPPRSVHPVKLHGGSLYPSKSCSLLTVSCDGLYVADTLSHL